MISVLLPGRSILTASVSASLRRSALAFPVSVTRRYPAAEILAFALICAAAESFRPLSRTALSIGAVAVGVSVLGDKTPQTVGLDKIFLRCGSDIIVPLDLIRKTAQFPGDLTVKCRPACRVIHPVGLR